MKVKAAEVLLVNAAGFVAMVVSGAEASTVHVYEAGEASVLFAESVALTRRV